MKLLSLILNAANGALSATSYRLRNNGAGIVTEISTDSGETYTTLATTTAAGATSSNGAITSSGTGTAATFGGGTGVAAPTTGAHVAREFVVGSDGALWVCTVAGTPGTWVKINHA